MGRYFVEGYNVNIITVAAIQSSLDEWYFVGYNLHISTVAVLQSSRDRYHREGIS